jgi:hypothetical protein
MKTELRVSADEAEVVRSAAAELGLELTDESQIRAAGGGAWAVFTFLVNDPFVQGALFGFLVSRGVTIERVKGGKVTVTVASLKDIWKAAKKLV